jgi:hypothetical protein
MSGVGARCQHGCLVLWQLGLLNQGGICRALLFVVRVRFIDRANRCGSLSTVILDQALRRRRAGTRAACCLWQCPPAEVALCRAAAKEPSFGAYRPTASPCCALATFRLIPLPPYVWIPTTILSSRSLPLLSSTSCCLTLFCSDVQGDEAGVVRTWSLDMSSWTSSSKDTAGVAATMNQVCRRVLHALVQQPIF